MDKLKVPLRQLETAVSKKDAEGAMKHREIIEQGLSEISSKFSKVDIAKQFMEQAAVVFNRMESELGSIISEKAINVSVLLLWTVISHLVLEGYCWYAETRSSNCWAIFEW